MTQTTEEKAQALVDAVRSEYPFVADFHAVGIALSRAIEQHEATEEELHDLRQKVNDIASVYNKMAFTVTETEPHLSHYRVIIGFDKSADASMCHDRLVSLLDFLNPAPKPDPLVEALAQLDFLPWKKLSGHADDFRAALDALGFEIREKNDGI